MKTRKLRRLSRARRRALLLQLIAAFGIGTAASASDPANFTETSTNEYQLVSTHATNCCPVPPACTPCQPMQIDGSYQSDDVGQPPVDMGDSFLSDDGIAAGDSISDAELDSIVNQARQPRTQSFALSTGSRGGLDAPSMMGDFFGGQLQVFSGSPPTRSGDTVALGGGDRQFFKISENVSPVPKDRVFLNYHHFENSLRDINGDVQDADRYTLGIEKTFWDGQGSLETRLPIIAGLDSTQIFGGDTRATEFGNLGFALKLNLLSDGERMLSGGFTMTVPTGHDYTDSDGLTVKNQTVHMAPFLGYLCQPNNSWFFQSFLQADFGLGGNDVTSSGTLDGIINLQNLLFVDASLGRWLKKRSDRFGNVTGIALLGELHYTSTLNDPDSVTTFGGQLLTNSFGRMDILNASYGLHIQRGLCSLRIGGSSPLRDDEEEIFDSEVFVQLNRLY